jgi:hypothetical protein
MQAVYCLPSFTAPLRDALAGFFNMNPWNEGDQVDVDLMLSPDGDAINAQNPVGAVFDIPNDLSWPGYTSLVLGTGAPSIVGATAILTFPSLIWVLGTVLPSPLTVYGYVTSDDASEYWLWYQLFDTPIVLANPNDMITFQPIFTMFSQNIG